MSPLHAASVIVCLAALSAIGCAGSPPTAIDRLRADRCAGQAGPTPQCSAACQSDPSIARCYAMQTEAERTSTTFTACYSVCARPSYCGGGAADWDCDCWSDCLARERPAVQNAYLVALDCRNAIAACR